VREIEDAELETLAGEGRWDEAHALFDRVALDEEFEEFLTLPAYEYLD
jgi:malate synthase